MLNKRRKTKRVSRRIAYSTPDGGLVWGTALERSVDIKQIEDEWTEYAKMLIIRARNATTQRVVAVAAFCGETLVDLSIRQGEELLLCVGAEAPAGWLIVEQQSDEGPRRGLVPATYVSTESLQQAAASPQRTPKTKRRLDDQQEKAATRLQARQRGKTGRQTAKTRGTRGLLPSAIWDLD